MRVLIVTSVEKEAAAARSAVEACDCDSEIVVTGVGRVNAAVATTEAILGKGPFDAIINAGVAGALPVDDAPGIGAIVIASRSVYFEEGIITPDGFRDAAALGFPLGEAGFDGNAIHADESLLACARDSIPDAHIGPIATVATCSGTDTAAREVAARTGAIAEAMEGAAVLHTAARFGVPALELRVISNTTGDRGRQSWDLASAFEALEIACAALCRVLVRG